MNREIKFRIVKDNKITDYFNLSNEFDCHVGWLENSILNQYTGLKDKNGKEIYEGDIVLVDSKTMKGIEIIHEGKKLTAYEQNPPTKGFIVFYKGIFGVHNKNELDVSEKPYYGALTWSVSYHEIEIIGNIYENPELIK